MNEIMMSILAFGGSTLAGRSLLALFDRVCGTRAMSRHPAEVWGISILLGTSFTSAAAFVWSDMGRPLSPLFSWWQIGLAATLGLCGMFQARRWSPSHPATPPLGVHSPNSGTPFSLPPLPHIRCGIRSGLDCGGEGRGVGAGTGDVAPSPQPSPPQHAPSESHAARGGEGAGGGPPMGERTPPASSLTSFARAGQAVLCVVLAAACGVTFCVPQTPGVEPASIGIKATILYESGTIDAPELVHPAPVTSRSRDPLLLPLLERHLYSLQGHQSDRPAGIWPLSMLLGLVLSVAGVLSRRTSPNQGWLLATGLALALTLISSGFGVPSVSAELCTASFHGAAVLCLWDAIQEAPGGGRLRGVLLASGMAASACFVQNEGLAFLVIDGLAWGVAALVALLAGGRLGLAGTEERPLRSVSRHLLGIGVFALFAAILLTPWMRYRATLPTIAGGHDFFALDVAQMRDRLSTIPASLPHLMQRMSAGWMTWILPGAVLLVAVFTVPRRSWNGPQIFLSLNLFGAWAALVFAAMLVPAENVTQSSVPSHLSQLPLIPAAILLVAGAGRPLAMTRQQSPTA